MYAARIPGQLKFAVAPIVVSNGRVQYVCAAALEILAFWGSRFHEEVKMALSNDRSDGVQPRQTVLADRPKVRDKSVEPLAPELSELGSARFEFFPGY